MKTSIVLIVFLTFIRSTGFAQSHVLKFRHITTEQGLSNSTIETIFQDSRGFMWFGTRDGLNRYDGSQMQVFRTDPNNVHSISDNFILCISEDHLHNLWIGTKNGLNYFDFRTNCFSRYMHDAKKKGGLSEGEVSNVYEDKSYNTWITTYGGGVNLLKKDKKTFIYFKHSKADKTSISSDMVNDLLEDSTGNFWFVTASGLDLFDRKTNSFKSYQNPSESSQSCSINYMLKIKEDKTGTLWLGTEDKGLILFDTKTKTYKQFKHDDKIASSLGSDMVKSLLIDKKGKIWIGSINGGLDLFNPATQTFLHYQNVPDNSASLSQKTVSAIYEDNQSNLWVGTHRGGLNLYTPGAEKFKLYRQEARSSSLGYYDVTAFCQDTKGRIWIGTDYGGLDRFDQQTQTFYHYRHDPYNNKSLSSDAVLDVMEDKSNNMWLSTWGGGLNLFDRNSGTFTRFLNNPNDKTSISSNHVQKTFQDSKGNLWVATYYGGLNLLDSHTHRFSQFTKDPKGIASIYGNNVVSLSEDRLQNLWIGTDDGGLNCYNLNTRTITHYFNSNGKTPDIRVIFNDSRGRLWVGQNGLYLFDRQRSVFNLYPNTAGLSTEFIKGILEDKEGNLWISTSNGLTKFNPDTHKFKKFNIEDGLQDLEFETNACMQTNNGEMFFGGGKGFNTFFPDQIKSNPFVPPVYITDFQVFNKDVLPGDKDSLLHNDISVTKRIYLNYLQSTFSFKFAALNYTAPLNNKYTYKLEKFDKNWINAGNEQKASYTNLDPGEYTFRVKASNNDEIWNEKGAAITIVIAPPFWATWWFSLIAALAIIMVGVTWYKSKRKRELIAMEEQKKEEMHQVQLQFFTNISHEFRTPLSLILGPIEKLRNQSAPPGSLHYYNTIHRNANRLLSLINELMDFRKVESGVLNLRVTPQNLGKFLNDIAEEFGDLTTQKQIEFCVKNADKYVGNYDEVWFDRQILEKIILNLLNNSFKYTSDGGKITMEVFGSIDDFKPSFENSLVIKNEIRSPSYFYIRVADNGIGISEESIGHLFERYYRISTNHLGSGVGLAFVKKLTHLHKGDIYVYSEKNKGTEIIIGLPMGEKHYDIKDRVIKESGVGSVLLESINHEHPFKRFEGPFANDQDFAETITATNDEHILLVDDNEELRHFFKDALSPFYHISEAENGRVGFELAKSQCPDLIVSDLMMPELNGIELCKAVKNDIETSHIPFIMLTAKDALASKIEGAEGGADLYFSKPVSIELLLIHIRNIFEQRSKLREHYKKSYYSEARDMVNSAKDKAFIDDLLKIIESQMVNPDLDVEFICQEIAMSRTKLYQKIKSITGQSIVEFTRSCRLKAAVRIMTHEDVPIIEVLDRVGIQTQSYFTRSFKKEFGKTPSQFLQDVNRVA